MTRYDRTLEEAIIAAGHSVRCAWQMPGPANTGVEGMECLIINGRTVIVQTFKDAGWDAYTPSRTNNVDQTIRDVMTVCGLTTGDPEYLARFPEAHRATADRAYQDGFQDGVDAGPVDGAYTVIIRYPDWADQDDNGWGGTFQAHITADNVEEAIDKAQYEAAVTTKGDNAEEDWNPDLNDFVAVAVFAGHLTDIGPTP